METVYAYEPLPERMTKSLFLAGPTPRDSSIPGWRAEAVSILEGLGYDGHVFIPEPRDGAWSEDYTDQVEWEESALHRADCIVFWVPRDLETMPAFTTNDEWGAWKYSGKAVFGAPKDAPKVRYQEYYADKLKVPMSHSLSDTLENALGFIGEGAERVGGEVSVPCYVWRQPSFQSWYQNQLDAGNYLTDARVLWQFTPGQQMFCWVLQVTVNVTSENRYKSNEFVLGRPDISSVILWYRAPTLAETKVVLVREFRSPARTPDCYIVEPPGGSSAKESVDELTTAVEELQEETGFYLNPSRLTAHPARQMYGTLSSVVGHMFSAEIDHSELKYFEAQEGETFGLQEHSEITYVEIYRVEDILERQITDWSTLGMVFAGLSGAMR